MGVQIVGVGATRFGRWPNHDHRMLVRLALDQVWVDLGNRRPVDSVWFGSAALHGWGQPNIRGQVVLEPFRDLPPFIPVHNVDAACATGLAALHAGARDVLAGADLVLVLGVEKIPMDPDLVALASGGFNHFDRWEDDARRAAMSRRLGWAPRETRSRYLDVSALHASFHMRRYGSTTDQLAQIAAKNHTHSLHNHLALYRVPMTPEQVLEDREVLPPFTRSMVAPYADGCAAVLLASDEVAQRLGGSRAVKLSTSFVSGRRRTLEEPSLTVEAARRAWAASGIGPTEVHVAEVHDATSFGELAATEDLGLCAPGDGGRWAASGASELGGALPVNVSGGLISKGHPIAATGLMMICDLVGQLRGEVGTRQVEGARIGVAQNAGGLIGLEEASCGVAVLRRETVRRGWAR